MKFQKIAVVILLLAAAVIVHAETALFNRDTPVRVTYQFRVRSSILWLSNSTILYGATTEQMMVNQISARHGNKEIRILRAEACSEHPVRVQYRYLPPRHTIWVQATAMLTGARTVSMARNQLLARHPGSEVQVLGYLTPSTR